VQRCSRSPGMSALNHQTILSPSPSLCAVVADMIVPHFDLLKLASHAVFRRSPFELVHAWKMVSVVVELNRHASMLSPAVAGNSGLAWHSSSQWGAVSTGLRSLPVLPSWPRLRDSSFGRVQKICSCCPKQAHPLPCRHKKHG
jgi:hypothetical protein